MSSQKVIELPRLTVSSVSPLTGELLREYEQHSDEAVENKIALAATTFRDYRKVQFAKRAAMMVRAAEILEKEKETFGRMMTQEMGKTLKSAMRKRRSALLGAGFMQRMRNGFWPMRSQDKCHAQFCALPADWPGAGGNAVELSLLAGVSVCRAGAHGRQRWIVEACFERSAMRPRH